MINLSWGRFPEQCIDKTILSRATADIEITNSLPNYSTPGGDLDLRKMIADSYGIGSENFPCLGLTVSTNLSHYIILKLYCRGRVITPDPTFSCYYSQFNKSGLEKVEVDYDELSNPNTLCRQIRPGDLISVVVPNNPTGELVDLSSITKILKHAYSKGSKVVVDATWHHTAFNPENTFLLWDLIKSAIKYKSIVILGISKNYGLSGLRCSLVFSASEIIDDILSWSDDLTVSIGQYEQHLFRYLLSRNTNPLRLSKLIELVSGNADVIRKKLEPSGFGCITPEAGIFSYVKLPKGMNSENFSNRLKQDGVLVYPSNLFSSKTDGIRLCLTESNSNTLKAMEIICERAP